MSTIIASNISDGTTSVPSTYVVNGSAKAWVNFDGFTNSIRDSFNISSLVDNGTGDYSTNISNSMNNDGYTFNTVNGESINYHALLFTWPNWARPSTASTMNFGSRTYRHVTTDRAYASDTGFIYGVAHGDLA